MSDRKEALTDLLVMVDAGVGIHPEKRCYTEEFCGLFDRCFDESMFDLFSAGYEGSLDAAKALHKEVLPGWSWEVRASGFNWSQATLWNPMTQPRLGYDFRAEAESPARAWLIAILKALIAQED